MTKDTEKQYQLEIDGKAYEVRIQSLAQDKATVYVNGKKLEVSIQSSQVVESQQISQPPGVKQSSPPQTSSPAITPSSSQSQPTNVTNSIAAMMPGVVITVAVEEGKKVATGDVLLVLEAMKMENEIRSDRSGVVEKIYVSKGQQVQAGDPLVTFS